MRKRNRNPRNNGGRQTAHSQKSDFFPDCECAKEHHEITEREIDGYKVAAFQCKKCETYGRRPIGFVFGDDSIPVPNFETLKEDTETELYYKLNFLSQVFPNRKTQILIARTKHELKTRFDALKYDIPNEGTRGHWLANQKAMRKVLAEVSEG